MKKTLIAITLILAALAVAHAHLLPGLVMGDDAELMVIRSHGFYRSFVDGHIPVRWISQLNEGYGYPVANFLYPLPFYIAVPFILIGLDVISAVKAVFVLSTVVSALTMFLWLRSWGRTLPAILGSLLYLVIPYRVFDLYARASIGEVVAFAIVPLVLWRVDKYLQKPNWSNIAWIGLSWSLLIPAHNSLAFLFSILIGGYIFLRKINQTTPKIPLTHKLINLVAIPTLTLFLSAWFWLPAVLELGYTRAPSIQISELQNHFQLIPDLALSFGLFPGLVLFVSAIFLRSKIYYFALISIILSLLLQFDFTQPIWHLLRLDTVLQFPFRLLAVSVVLIPFIFTLLTDHLIRQKQKLVLFPLIILLAVVFSMSLHSINQTPRSFFPEGYYTANFDTTTNQREFTPKWVTADPSKPATDPAEIPSNLHQAEILYTQRKTQEVVVGLNVPGETEVRFNTHYYPGWQVLLDDNLVDYQISSDGRIIVSLDPPGNADKRVELKLIWQETALRQFANYLSLSSLLLVICFLVYRRSKRLGQTIYVLSLILILTAISSAVIFKRDQLLQVFDPVSMEEKYLKSQWMDPASTEPLGDHGLYAWAGWAYVQGVNPILINPEMPPLGKYLIGGGTLLTGRPGLVGLFFSMTFLGSLYLLSYSILQIRGWSLFPVALMSWEPVLRNSLAYPMLDGIQLTGLCLAFWALIRADKSQGYRWYLLAGLGLGLVISSKFYATGILVGLSLVLFYLISGRWNQLKFLLVSLSVMFLIHLVSYLRFFQLGGSLREYLGIQKWIYHFYAQGSPDVTVGSYWLLAMFNRWQVWWGSEWGQSYTIASTHWRLTWPVAVVTAVAWLVKLWTRCRLTKLRDKLPMEYLLVTWLLVYGIFLTFIGGWPHYMLLFLPFSFVLLARLAISLLNRFSVNKIIKQFSKF